MSMDDPISAIERLDDGDDKKYNGLQRCQRWSSMLIGIGLGPCDPELLTLKAIKMLEKSDKVFVPGKLALELVLPYTDAEILDFPMTHDKTVLARTLDRNADIVAAAVTSGGGDGGGDCLVAFGLIGDPNFLSTFIHLKNRIREKYPDITIETIPGISSITAFASRIGVGIDRLFLVFGFWVCV